MAGGMKTTNAFVSHSTRLMVFLLLLFCVPQTSGQPQDSGEQPVNLQDRKQLIRSGTNSFCYVNSIVPNWRQTWTRIQVKVWSSKPFNVKISENEKELQTSSFSLWSVFVSILHQRYNETTINVGLFNEKTCFNIDPADSKTPYTLKALRKFDLSLFLVFLTGVLLFVFADSLSRSQVFYYSTGMSTGLIASLIILIFILSRFLPRRGPFYVLLFGGWSVSMYAIQLVYKNLQTILREHWHLALGYVSLVGFISFAVCYRYGPLVEERSINLLSWTLQIFGLLLIYCGIQIQQVAFAVIVAALISKFLEYPVSLALVVWRKIRVYVPCKPKPRRLLTEEEYQIEAEVETQRALEELRKYCQSPEFSPWKTVSRLQSPKRFADFVEGSLHLAPNEVSVHAQEYGFGGSYMEDELYATDEDYEDENDIKPTLMNGE
ncbi:nuclear envelope integral membrane protein 1 [Genypterus blacodes]|uniref:nuclear envelope integral membrane protein 1 n=1 Tax=Genypterus blacodes TaxID=154954 RepID=UPI003F76973D